MFFRAFSKSTRPIALASLSKEKPLIDVTNWNTFQHALDIGNIKTAWLEFNGKPAARNLLSKEQLENLLSLVIRKLGKKDRFGDHQVNVILSTIKSNKFKLSEAMYGPLIKFYCHHRNSAKVSEMLSEMREKEIFPTIDIYNSVLKMHLRHKSDDYIQSFIQKLEDSGVKLNEDTFLILIDSCVNAQKYELALKYFEKMQSHDIVVSSNIYASIIKCYGHLKDMTSAEKLFAKIENPDSTVFAAMISSYMQSDAPDRNQKIENLLQTLKDDNVSINVKLYEKLMMYHFQNRNTEAIYNLHREMITNDVTPSNQTLFFMMNHLIDAGDIEMAMKFLIELRNSNTSVHQSVYRALMQKLCELGKTEQLYEVFHMAIQQRTISPLYNIALQGATTARDITMVKHIFEKFIQDPNCKPNAITYRWVLQAYLEAGYVTSAYELLNEIVEKENYQPDFNQYFQLFKACLISRKYELAASTLLKIRKIEIEDITSVKNLIIDHQLQFEDLIDKMTTANNGNIEKSSLALEIYGDLRWAGAQLSERTLRLVMEAYLKRSDLIGVTKIWNVLSSNYSNPEAKSASVLLKAANELGKASTARAIKAINATTPFQLDKDGYENLVFLDIKHGNGKEVTHLVLDMINAGHEFTPKFYQKIQKTLSSTKGIPSTTLDSLNEFFEEHFSDCVEKSQELEAKYSVFQ